MQDTPKIRRAEESDLETCVATLSEAFANDPVLNWVFRSTELYPNYFRLLLREVYLPRGIIHMDEHGRGAAIWLPPEERFDVAPRWSLLKFGLQLTLREGVLPLLRMRQMSRVYHAQLPREPYYYLQFIGVRAAYQGRGLGATLLEHGAQMCEEHNMPAYLESSNERNIPLYERHGFRILNTQAVASRGPAAWFMWRDSR